MRLLVVEDEPRLADYLHKGLSENGYVVDVARDGIQGRLLACEGQYDLVLLDLMLPGIDGFGVLAAMRERGRTPVLMLTARDNLDSKLTGFDSGADDYMVKPFALQELSARLEVLGRRGKGNRSRVLQLADLSFNLDTLMVNRGGKSITLNPIGLKLLQTLMESSPSVVTRQELETRVWGEELPDSDSLRVHIHGLRALIDKPFDKPLIQTRHGIGYRMVDPDALPT